MRAARTLSAAFAERHPQEVAQILESAPPGNSMGFLCGCPAETAAAVFAYMSPLYGAECLAVWPDESVASVLAASTGDLAVRILRAMEPSHRRRLIELLEPELAGRFERSMSYAEGTAGASMNPTAFTVPDDVDVSEARRRVRGAARYVGDYVYVTDRAQALRGVVDLRDLMLAPGELSIAEVMRRSVESVRDSTPLSVAEAVAHAGGFSALPVVDRENSFVGVLASTSFSRSRSATRPSAAGPGAFTVGLAHLLWTVGSVMLDPLFAAARNPGIPPDSPETKGGPK